MDKGEGVVAEQDIALLQGPIFGYPDWLHGLSVDLTPDDRYTDRHQSRKISGGAGVNDHVLRLYPDIAGEYDRLYQAIISVRYRNGLPDRELPRIVECVERVRQAESAGLLVA